MSRDHFEHAVKQRGRLLAPRTSELEVTDAITAAGATVQGAGLATNCLCFCIDPMDGEQE